jgi:cell division septation protein DedD
MRGVFDEQQLDPVQARRDTELTLGSGTLLAAFFGLVLLCGLCFGLGYAVGHRSAENSVQESTSAIPALPVAGSIAKPSAHTQAPAAPAPDASGSDQPVAPAGASNEAVAETQPATNPPPAAQGAPSAQPAAGANVRPAVASAVQFMVQIAAVSNPEDAQVLTAALRKRGYLVTVRRDPADNLIHVRIGPFASQAEANSWSMKLLNDGYNAIVQ